MLERSQRNGYHVARVEWLDDFPEGSAAELAVCPRTVPPLTLQHRVTLFALSTWQVLFSAE